MHKDIQATKQDKNSIDQQRNAATRSADHLDGRTCCAPLTASCLLTGRSRLEHAWHECDMYDDVGLDIATATCMKQGANSAHNFQKASPKCHASCGVRRDQQAQDNDVLSCCTAECFITRALKGNRNSSNPLCLDGRFACFTGCLYTSPQQLAEAFVTKEAGEKGGRSRRRTPCS